MRETRGVLGRGTARLCEVKKGGTQGRGLGYDDGMGLRGER